MWFSWRFSGHRVIFLERRSHHTEEGKCSSAWCLCKTLGFVVIGAIVTARHIHTHARMHTLTHISCLNRQQATLRLSGPSSQEDHGDVDGVVGHACVEGFICK